MIETGIYKQVCFSFKVNNQTKEVPALLSAVLYKARKIQGVYSVNLQQISEWFGCSPIEATAKLR